MTVIPGRRLVTSQEERCPSQIALAGRRQAKNRGSWQADPCGLANGSLKLSYARTIRHMAPHGAPMKLAVYFYRHRRRVELVKDHNS